MPLSSLAAQELTLEQAVSRFLVSSPVVAAEKEKVNAARGRLRQSGVWSNPVLHYSQEGLPVGRREASFDDQEFQIGAFQEFELGGRRARRRDLAEIELKAEESRFEDFLRLRKRSVSRLFLRAVYASKRKGSLEKALGRYSEIRDAHAKRYEFGEVSGLAQLKIETEELSYLAPLAAAEREFNAGWSELATWIGWETPAVPALVLEPPDSVSAGDLELMVRRALESRPDLAVQTHAASAAQARVELEKAQNVPNLNLGAGYKRDFGRNSFFVSVQVPLPIWDRRRGAIESELAAGRRQTTLTRWKQTWIRHEVQRAHELFSKLLSASRRFDAEFLDKLDRTVAITALSYEQGEAGVLDYLDALRTQREALLERYRLLEELHLARTELEASIGMRLRDIKP